MKRKQKWVCDCSLFVQGLIPIETCGTGYWIISSLQIPVAIAFTLWILYKQKAPQPEDSPQKVQRMKLEHICFCFWYLFIKQSWLLFLVKELEEAGPAVEPSKKLIFPVMALLAGILGGMFGIGGGMLISPFLLQFGIAPEASPFVSWTHRSFVSILTLVLKIPRRLERGTKHSL